MCIAQFLVRFVVVKYYDHEFYNDTKLCGDFSLVLDSEFADK